MILEFVEDYRKLLRERQAQAMDSVLAAESWDDFVARRARYRAWIEVIRQFDDFVKAFNNR